MPKRTLGVIVGSNRRESINRRLAKETVGNRVVYGR
mgnify:CR=1 FL=1